MTTFDNESQESLAIFGGEKVRDVPLPVWPHFDEEVVAAASSVLRSGKVNYWTGDEGKCFEEEYAAAIGCSHAIALSNGTAALELALQGLGVGPGDEVVVPSRTFIASASCAVMRGAKPIVADVDGDSQTITVDAIERVLSPRTKAIIAVHLAGWPCEMDSIMELARRHGIKVVEDCAQAHHAKYKGKHVGTIGDVGAFSFCQDKIMTTGGEGGMLTTSDDDLWKRCWSLKDHGKDWDVLRSPHQPHLFRWLHGSFGTNWRLTEMQSAMGRIMLKQLPESVAIRRQNAAQLNTRLSSIASLRIPQPPSHIEHSYYKFYAFVNSGCLAQGWTRDRIVQAVQAEGIPCGPGSCSEIYLEKAFVDSGLKPLERLPIAKELGETSLMFMVHPTLKSEDVDQIAQAVSKVLSVATQATLSAQCGRKLAS